MSWIVLTPAILTIIGNILFYLFIKSRIDSKIEMNKISYSGVFKEKIDIYRELLERTYDIKKTLNKFRYLGNPEDGKEIMQSLNDYIRFYSINRPFLSDSILEDTNTLKTEFQEIFETFYKHISSGSASLEEFFKAGNKLNNKVLEDIEKRVIKEMKEDLNTIEI